MVKAVDRRASAVLAKIAHMNNPVGAEVGVFHGRLAMRLLKGKPDLFLHMIDSWLPASEQSERYINSGDAVAKLNKFEMSRAKHDAFANTKAFELRRKIHQGDSVEMAEVFAEGELDFVFVDADHSYDGVVRDIAAWYPKVKTFGVISGHDYDSPTFPGVKKAVDEFMDREGLVLELGEDRTWFARVE